MNSKKLILVLAIAFLLAGLSTFNIASVHALSESSNVALVPNKWGYSTNGGSLPLSGFPGGFSPTFTDLSPVSIRDDTTDPLVAGGYDTVVLVQIDYIQNWLANPTFKSRIENFVFNGGKLLIWDSECIHNDYSNFTYPFTLSMPGQMGSNNGIIWTVEDNTLSHNDTTSPYYVNTTSMCWSVDIADANVMVTADPNWCTDLVSINYLGAQGPVQAYARYGTGLIIWNGLDMDYMEWYDSVVANDNVGYHNLHYIWYLNLKQQWNPDNLPCGFHAAGITVTPNTAVNPLGVMHTVTATVRDEVGTPIPGVAVNISIYAGPSVGMGGAGVTNAMGEVYFSWTSNVSGTDHIIAAAHCPFDPTVTIFDDTATKTWGITPVIPEYPLGTIMGLLAFFAAAAVFIGFKRSRPTPFAANT